MKIEKTKSGVFRLFFFALLGVVLFLPGCGKKEPDASIRKKLDMVIGYDFKAIAGELPKTSLSDSPHFRIAQYTAFKKGAYSALAVVDYYYLRNVNVKRTVKYRYVKNAMKWERYGNEYRYFNDAAGR